MKVPDIVRNNKNYCWEGAAKFTYCEVQQHWVAPYSVYQVLLYFEDFKHHGILFTCQSPGRIYKLFLGLQNQKKRSDSTLQHRWLHLRSLHIWSLIPRCLILSSVVLKDYSGMTSSVRDRKYELRSEASLVTVQPLHRKWMWWNTAHKQYKRIALFENPAKNGSSF